MDALGAVLMLVLVKVMVRERVIWLVVRKLVVLLLMRVRHRGGRCGHRSDEG